MVAVIVLLGLAAVSVLAYASLSSPRPVGCPNIFATVSFQDSRGFIAVVHPSPQITEFVLGPNQVGQVTVSYTSSNNLSASQFTDHISVWKADLSTGSLAVSSGLNVTLTNVKAQNANLVVANYTVTAGSSEGVYVLGFPSTCLTAFVNVGTQPYTGPLPWLTKTVE